MALTNAQYDRVMRYYDERRALHRLEADERLREAEAAIPSFRSLLNEITSCYTAIARDNLRHPDAIDPAHYDRLDMCLKEKEALLREHGFPADYLDVKPDCPLCGDTGFAGGEKCACFDRVVVSLIYRDHSAGKIPEEHDFEHFKTDWYSDTIKQGEDGPSPRQMAEDALRAARHCVDLVGSEGAGPPQDSGEPVNLLIYGQVGVGKTFLSEAILRECLRRGRPGLYFSSQELFDLLADAAFDRSDEAASYARLVRSGDLLVIDDLGTELTNSLVESELFRVLNDRARAGLTTVISTNLTLNELAERYSERIFSRLVSGYRLVKLTGDDLRIRLRVRS